MTAHARRRKSKRATRSREYDDATVDHIVQDVERAVMEGRGEVAFPRKGRPSLSGAPEVSPAIAFRVSPELKRRAETAAAHAGVSVSALARQALERALQG